MTILDTLLFWSVVMLLVCLAEFCFGVWLWCLLRQERATNLNLRADREQIEARLRVFELMYSEVDA